MYKKFTLFSLLFICISYLSIAQYGDEWIQYDQTYFKFKVGQEGVYRISASLLSSYGMSGVTGNQFAIYKNGIEQPIYVSTSGMMGTDDYIEFYANKNDGSTNTSIYLDPSFQPTNKFSIFLDSASYFITYSSGSHLRLNDYTFTLPPTLPSPEPYFYYEQWYDNGTKPNVLFIGKNYDIDGTINFPSSEFDQGEGYLYKWSTGSAVKSVQMPFVLNQAYKSSPVVCILNLSLTTNGSSEDFNLTFNVGTTAIFDTTIKEYTSISKSLPFSNSLISTSGALNTRTYTSTGRIGYNFMSVTYPRNFDFTGFSNTKTKMSINESATKSYLKFTNLPTTDVVGYLYDFTNKQRYQTLVTSNSAQYYINESLAKRDMYFITQNEIANITQLTEVPFVNYKSVSNQGDYIFISYSGLINAATTPIQNYKTYRQSALGGSYQPIIADANILYDQFGYGDRYSPLGIRNFLQYAYDSFSNRPKMVLLIGKGLLYPRYDEFITSTPGTFNFNDMLPTFGHPGCDNLFVDFNKDSKPELAIGRLSMYKPEQISLYLNKIKAYENAVRIDPNPNLDNTLWKKTALHIGGGTGNLQTYEIIPTLKLIGGIYEGLYVSGKYHLDFKSTTEMIDTVGESTDSLINSGLNQLTYFGHGSAYGFEYNLNDPNEYNCNPRFPIMNVFGCDVSAIFMNNESISEKYINSENGGAITFLASSHYGYTNYLKMYMNNLYKNYVISSYGLPVGKQIMNHLNDISTTDKLYSIHKQITILQGDPATATYSPQLPDYFVDQSTLIADRVYLTTEDPKTNINAFFYNLGKGSNDTVLITIKHERPNGEIINLSDTVYKSFSNVFNHNFLVKLDPIKDVGLNKYHIYIDPLNNIEEISEINNTAVINIFLAENTIKPIYPYDFSIMHQQNITLKASALNTFETGQNFIFQIDTTALFNSPLKQTKLISNSIGGLIKWTPPITYMDSVVYYWRVAIDSMDQASTVWNSHSFIYLKNGSDGWNQSHFYQLKQDEPFNHLSLEEPQRQFRFSNINNELMVRNRVYNPENPIGGDVSESLNGKQIQTVGCSLKGTIQFTLYDTLSGQPIEHASGAYGSIGYCGVGPRNKYIFEFGLYLPESRKLAADFIDSIPPGVIYVVKNYLYDIGSNKWDGSCVPTWKVDDTLYGVTNTLYYKLKNVLGFDQIDSFNRKRVFIFMNQMGSTTFPKQQRFSIDSTDVIVIDTIIHSKSINGYVESTIIGPASKWTTFLNDNSHPFGNPENDSISFEIYGLDLSNNKTLLYTGIDTQLDLSFIDVANYPKLQLKWYSSDTLNRTSAHLRYWRVMYQPVPEAALNPSAYFVKRDTLNEGETYKLGIAVENLTPYDMDSMLVHYDITNNAGVTGLLNNIRYRKLPGLDTLIATLEFDPKNYPEQNHLFIEANPFNDQPEQYHPNNIGYLPFYLIADKYNPVLDVTFDGIHILDRDLVSAKPLIKVLLRDENKYALLTDTNILRLSVLYPGATTPTPIPIDGTIATFIPPTSSKNEAVIEYKPTFKEDGIYRLIVNGADLAGNKAEDADGYSISFTVENKSTISNLLNYPNPFSTSTAFVFTLSGSEIPSQFKIQILTVTGKIVREITKDEIGPIHIGRNVTEYKWDGRDQYGQLLGNGVYLYRLVTSINGNKIEHRKNATIDKYFKHTYGKMYIMR